jgi:hypothetical protein
MSRKLCFRSALLILCALMMTTPSRAVEVPVLYSNTLTQASEAVSAPWFFDVVDTYPPDPPLPAYDVGQHVSIALHPDTGTPIISYYDSSYKMLRTAEYGGTGEKCGPNADWACEIIDHKNWVGMYNSIAFGWNGLPRISYYDETDNALKLAVRTPFEWDIHTIHDPLLTSAGMYSSLAEGYATKTHIAYYYSNFPGPSSLRYAKYVGSSGNCDDPAYYCEIVDSGNGRGKYTSLALDSAERPHIAYYDQGNDALKFAYYYNDYWYYRRLAAPVSPSGGQHASLVIDTNNGDRPHIAHFGGADHTLKYATFVGAGFGNCGPNQTAQNEWLCMDIADMGTSTEPRGISIALDPAGYPVIAYQTGTSRLNIARPAAALGQLTGNCGVDPFTFFYTWQCDPITPIGFGFRQGDFLSLAVNSAGLGTIAYYGSVVSGIGNLEIGYQRLEVFVPITARNAQ